MRNSIVLCSGGDDGDMAASWAEDRAREARLSARAVKMYGDQVRIAYHEACRNFVGRAGEKPVLKISLEPSVLTPRFDMIDAAKAPDTAYRSPRAIRLLRAAVALRRAERASAASA